MSSPKPVSRTSLVSLTGAKSVGLGGGEGGEDDNALGESASLSVSVALAGLGFILPAGCGVDGGAAGNGFIVSGPGSHTQAVTPSRMVPANCSFRRRHLSQLSSRFSNPRHDVPQARHGGLGLTSSSACPGSPPRSWSCRAAA